LLKRMVLLSLFILFVGLTSFSQTMNSGQVIDIAKEDAKTAFVEGLFREASGWKIDGWLRVVSEPIFKYFENLSELHQKKYTYIFTVELNKLYFESLMNSGKEIDPFFFNKDIWDRISVMPMESSDIKTFVRSIVDNPKYAFIRGQFDIITEMELSRVLAMYEMELFPEDWLTLFSLEFISYVIKFGF